MIKQVRIKKIGAIKDLAVRTMFYISLLNFAMITITAYHTTIRYYLNIPFWLYIFTIGFFGAGAMLFEYMFVLPSQLEFHNRQIYIHNNPIRRDLEDIKKELNLIKSMVSNHNDK